MTRAIHPLIPDDLPELSQFLTAGFHTRPDADFAAPDVLRWKYLEPQGDQIDVTPSEYSETTGPSAVGCKGTGADANAPRSYLARDVSGRIIGHIGLCRTAFEGQSIIAPCGRVTTIHIIDWLGSPDHPAVGMSLMRTAHEGVPTQFGLGVSQAALVVGERAGYELRDSVPVYLRVLRSAYWLRLRSLSRFQRGLRLVRDTAHRWMRPAPVPRAAAALRQVSTFGSEITPIVARAKTNAILTQREPTRLNSFLRFPRQRISGWHLHNNAGQLCGFAVLNVVPNEEETIRTGKIVDCLLDGTDVALWHAAMHSLTEELVRQGADVAQAYGSTPWAREALQLTGYTSRFRVKFHIRDRQGLIPHKATFHLTPLEGDYAYT